MAKNPLEMSDDEFLGLNGPKDIPTSEEVVEKKDGEEVQPVVETKAAPATGEQPVVEAKTEEEPVVDDPAKETVEEEVTDPAKKTATGSKQEAEPKTAVEPKKDPATTPSKEEKVEQPTSKTTEAAATTPDYKVLYEQLMAPLKANGRTIELKSPEEAIQLMQMGANYTKKMQAITPYRKVLTMLENNALLDENKLSFLIDLDKKNPEAIKKLVKECGIDPLDLGADSKTTYFEGNHRVTDDEVNFKTAVEDVKSNSHGVETLQSINAWDQASKEVLWKNPELIEVLRTQHENGIYARIQTEIERRRTLGTIPANVPFLNAYKVVGDELQAAGAFGQPAAKTTPAVTPKGTVPTPVATRVQTPKPAVVNNTKVSAASATRSTPRKASGFVNPLALSDDEFLKQMDGRV